MITGLDGIKAVNPMRDHEFEISCVPSCVLTKQMLILCFMLYKITWNITLKDLKVFQNTEAARAMLTFFPEWGKENKIIKFCFLIASFIWKQNKTKQKQNIKNKQKKLKRKDKFLFDYLYKKIVVTVHM